MTELKEIKEKRFSKQIGGALFGALISLGITSSIQTGSEYIFGTESEQWGIGFWGNHHILRVIASLVGTSIGSFSAGCIAKIRGGLWGMMSALPASLFWLVIGAIALSQFFNGPLGDILDKLDKTAGVNSRGLVGHPKKSK